MRVLIQRCINSSVIINDKVNGKCEKGYVILVGFTHNDERLTIIKMVDKIINLRVFEDDSQKMNLSIIDTNGSVLSISQFTLYADVTGGRRPSFSDAMPQEDASVLYNIFNEELSKYVHVETGIFKSDMKVNIVNDGPVTIFIDSKDFKK